MASLGVRAAQAGLHGVQGASGEGVVAGHDGGRPPRCGPLWPAGCGSTPGGRQGPDRAASPGSRPADWVCPAAGSRASASSSATRTGEGVHGLRTSSRAAPAAARSRGAGSTRSPSMVIANVSGSTSMSGSASLLTMSALPTSRVGVTADSRRRSPSRSARPSSSAAGATKVTAWSLPSASTSVGRISTGCGVGIDAFGSPSAARTIAPPLITSSGGCRRTAGPTAPGPPACRPRPSRPRGRCRARSPG